MRGVIAMCRRLALSCVLLLLGGGATLAQPDLEREADEKLLRDARVTTDGPGLLAFFRERTLADADRAGLATTVARLGDDSFEARERASRDLVRAGAAAVPFLLAARDARDAEVVRRAADCLREIEQGTDRTRAAAAARLLATRRPEAAAEVLLAYLPSAGDEEVEEAVVGALEAAGLRDGKAAPALRAALKDKEPSRRAAAAAVVGGASADERRAVAALLTDPEAAVRYRAAAALVRAGDKAAVPAFLALLSEGTPAMAWRVEDTLYRLGGAKPTPASLGNGDDAARRRARQAWEGWWKVHGGEVDLGLLGREEPQLGLTLVCDITGGPASQGRVAEYGRDGKAVWQLDGLGGPIDAQVLPGGRVLVAEINRNRVTERTLKGEILWEAATTQRPIACQRLPNGNTFIATESELLEVNRERKTVSTQPRPAGIYYAVKLRNGHVVCAHRSGHLIELDAAGKEVRSVPCAGTEVWAGVEVLPNGHFLVAQYGPNKVIEVDTQGKRLWEASATSPSHATRLRNGNTLVATPNDHKVVELDRAGKVVWTLDTGANSRPFRVKRR